MDRRDVDLRVGFYTIGISKNRFKAHPKFAETVGTGVRQVIRQYVQLVLPGDRTRGRNKESITHAFSSLHEACQAA